MDGIPASFNPWTLLASEDSGDCIGKAKSKDDEAKKRDVPTWANNKAMNSSTPAKKKKEKKKKKPPAPSNNNPPAANGKGPVGKQNAGAPNANRNGASNGSRNQSAARQGGYYNGGYGAPMNKEQQQPGAAVDDTEARRPVREPEPVPLVPAFGLWLEKSPAKKAGAGGAKATNSAAAAGLSHSTTTSNS